MSVWLALAILYVATASVMGLLDLWRRRSGNAGVVDVGWSFGLVGAGLWLAAVADGDPYRRALTAALAAVWGLRLGVYLLGDRVLGSAEEDGRYRMLREKWGDRADRNFTIFFQVQAAWVVLFALPWVAAMYNPRPLWAWHDGLAVAVWLTAVGGESLADRQLARFRRRPDSHGRTCREGLWRYSRHPNYFFEWVHWFTYPLLAVGSGFWWLSLLGPVVMLVFLYKLTGIAYTEKRALASRGDDYRRYQQTTSAFVPWPPRKEPHT
mgnify:CR=1 FL=1